MSTIILGKVGRRMRASAWRNPYVTDGLSWCFIGDKDASGTSWIDQANSIVAIPSSGVTFGSNKFNITSSPQYLNFADSTTLSNAIVSGNDFSIEICARVNYFTSGNRLITIGNSDGNLFVLRGVGNNGVSCVGIRGGTVLNCANIRTALSNTATICVVFSGDKIKMFANGALVKAEASISVGSVSAIGNVYIGNTNAVSYAWTGCYHSLRGYTKALSAAEIAHNYAIDKERFGL